MRGCGRSEEHTSELQSRQYIVCRLLLAKKKVKQQQPQQAQAYRYSMNDLDDVSDKYVAVSKLRFFFFNDAATTEIYTLSLPDALPISGQVRPPALHPTPPGEG